MNHLRPILILLVVVCSGRAMAHPAHSQVTEIEWNQKTGCFEVAVKLDAAGLEDSISLERGSRFRLESAGNVDRDLSNWLPQQFQIRTGTESRPGQVRWAGYELELHTIWLFFEYRPASRIQHTSPIAEQIHVDNRCLLDVRPETVHFIQLRQGYDIFSAHCSSKTPTARFRRNDSVRSLSLTRP